MSTQPDEYGFISVRPMLIEDLEAVAHIDHISFSLPWPVSAFRQELGQNGFGPNRSSIVRVAEMTDGEGKRVVVGLLVIWMILDEAHIATIATHPDYRRRGVAARLMADGLAESLRKGASLATLEVRAGNTAAQELYRQFGFEVAGRRPRYYRDNFEDAVIMTIFDLKLKPSFDVNPYK
jgi:ribosomal-protein-alanine N-acetyltransferase